MATFQIRAWSPGLPVDDLLAHPEGGAEAAATAAARLFPSAALVWQHTGTWSDPGEVSDGAVLLSTYGPTTVVLGPLPGDAAPEPDLGSFSFQFQSVSMTHAIEVHAPGWERTVVLGPGGVEYEDGAPLPFEPSDWTDDAEFAAAASRWMFGYSPAGPSPDDRIDMWQRPLHVLRG